MREADQGELRGSLDVSAGSGLGWVPNPSNKNFYTIAYKYIDETESEDTDSDGTYTEQVNFVN